MRKDFDSWNEEKKIIHAKKQTDDFFVNPREIWFVKMGQNIGFEENGKEQFLRPVIVLKKVGNLFFTVALTSKGKNNHWLYHKLTSPDFQNKRYEDSSYVILSQVKVTDKKRFFENMGIITHDELDCIKQKLRTILF